jgi:hypothetical protein
MWFRNIRLLSFSRPELANTALPIQTLVSNKDNSYLIINNDVERVHHRAQPHSNAEIMAYLFNDSPLFIGGQYNNHFYLPEFGGWLRAEPIYVDLNDTARAKSPP